VVTHVMPTVYRVAKRIVMLHEGQFIEVGSPAEAQKTNNSIVNRFIMGGQV
jgi:ABC-type transporter Mla maintaining outer membrane lipid asymmetry ATPase subunit MlaF